MGKYNKAVGSIVGGLAGILFVAFGLTETSTVPVVYQPMVDTLVTLVTGALGTYIAPKNSEG